MILAPRYPCLVDADLCASASASSTASFDLPTPVVPQIVIRGHKLDCMDSPVPDMPKGAERGTLESPAGACLLDQVNSATGVALYREKGSLAFSGFDAYI